MGKQEDMDMMDDGRSPGDKGGLKGISKALNRVSSASTPSDASGTALLTVRLSVLDFRSMRKSDFQFSALTNGSPSSMCVACPERLPKTEDEVRRRGKPTLQTLQELGIRVHV